MNDSITHVGTTTPRSSTPVYNMGTPNSESSRSPDSSQNLVAGNRVIKYLSASKIAQAPELPLLSDTNTPTQALSEPSTGLNKRTFDQASVSVEATNRLEERNSHTNRKRRRGALNLTSTQEKRFAQERNATQPSGSFVTEAQEDLERLLTFK